MNKTRVAEGALHIALQLMKRGRFADAVLSLRDETRVQGPSHALRWALLADALQRTGKNIEAEQIAHKCLGVNPSAPEVAARCRFVLGNIFRERGDIRGAITQFQSAATLAENDLELACWAQLRLMTAIGELAGSHSAMARLTEVNRCLARLGDARPFAALHLWIAEVETTRGSLDSARRHMRIADSLLGKVDDAWLRGYFAINSSCVSYYSAEMSDAQRWAESAIEATKVSGHAAGRRAAFANLGHIEFSLGRLRHAEDCFRRALEASDRGSTSQFAILDSIAQIKLHRGELDDCQTIVNQLDELSVDYGGTAKPNGYAAWALQTRIQLLLKQGRLEETSKLCDGLTDTLETISQPRIRAVLGLLSVEASLASGHFDRAAVRLGSVLSAYGELPPDLLAETERIIGKTLSLSGTAGLAQIHFDRAIATYEVIGHATGKAQAVADISTIEPSNPYEVDAASVRSSVDRVRALLETKRRPELFAIEVFNLLKELDCATDIEVAVERESQNTQTMRSRGSLDRSDGEGHGLGSRSVLHLGSADHGTFQLKFQARQDCASLLAAITFQRIIEMILAIPVSTPEFAESETLWSANESLSNGEIVFAADSMMEVLRTINKVAATNLSVLITGETGTGKEVLAKTLHDRSERASRPFIPLNCAAVPRDLLESQLFGHRRGAFSGATEHFPGVVRAANGGTLLLDEIGEIPLETQPKLLRFLESGEVHPLGESRPTKVDVRLIFATNANLEDLVKQRRFREDLLFRINVIHLKVPPLRERREDIPLLIGLFARKFSRELSKEPPKFAPEAIELLILNSWPGNVRQLSNEIRRVVAIVDKDDVVTPDLLSHDVQEAIHQPRSHLPFAPNLSIELDQELSKAVTHVERRMLEHALSKAHGRVALAAKMLGLSRKGLYLKRQRLGLLDPRNTTPLYSV
jgi:DNA-binding NtrC family response regulator/tetratricopeptide (TPR) repeat protein